MLHYRVSFCDHVYLPSRGEIIMSKPYEITKEFAQLDPNMALLVHLYRNHPQEYIRKRLKAIQLLWEGKTREEVVAFLHIDRTTIISWLKMLIEHGVDTGLRLLATKKSVKKAGKLTQEQQETLIRIVTTESPNMYGYDQNIFTGQILVEIVQGKWHLAVSDQTIYTLLHRHKLSYQRGHRDYENADPAAQKIYAETVKKTGNA
jgi:transposase